MGLLQGAGALQSQMKSHAVEKGRGEEEGRMVDSRSKDESRRVIVKGINR